MSSATVGRLARLFPAGVVLSVSTLEGWVGALYPEEEARVRHAAPKRRREFTAGRVGARQALARLGVSPQPLPADVERRVIWPAGIVGSISHCDDLCAVAVARSETVASLGLDVERAEPLDANLVSLICSASERTHLDSLPAGAPWSKLVFAAKESVYKCLSPLVQTFLEFHHVTIDFDPDAGSFSAELLHPSADRLGGTELRGRFVVDAAHLYCGIALPPAEH
ncbi:MAG TPA: 4'-phosphopantetheinyl transferase superfamily protein [Candidatus Polarisedimenticolaceae bacterium]|nr:4'-phosphopantetheinyl transferase superfamily protein [Candidatus Polarisedimenticolaceae bacterium]